MEPVPAPGHSPSLATIEAWFASLIPRLTQEPRGRGRPEILPAAMLWGAIILCILRGQVAQRAVWRAVTGAGLWHFAAVTVTPEAVRKRLHAIGPERAQAVFTQITAAITAQWDGDLTLAPVATGGVFAIDDTTLDKVVRAIPAAEGPVRPLAGRLHTVFDVRRQCFQRVIPTTEPFENEKTAARDLIWSLPKRCLVLMDRGYLSFRLYDDITDGKRFFVTRLGEAITVRSRHVFTRTERVTDELVFLGKYRADRSKHTYRLITIQPPTGEPRRYLTNIEDPAQLSPAAIVRLYARRWDIELAFKLLKCDLGLHLIWATSWPMIQLQIWATLLIAQVVLVLRLQVALRAGVDLFDVSLELLIRDLPAYVARGEEDVIGAIAARGTYGGIIRSSRRTRYAVPDALPIEPPPKGLHRIQKPRYAGKT